MKKLILLLVLIVSLGSCLNEGDIGCPRDMHLSFELEDLYVPGDYDTRITNDVLLYIFNKNSCVYKQTIPYSDISGGREFAIRKTKNMHGDLSMVAWSVSATRGDQSLIPNWNVGDDLSSKRLELSPKTRADANCNPINTELYLGTYSTVEKIDEPTHHRISMITGSCRIIVNVLDQSTGLAQSGADPRIELRGSKSRMNMQKEGVGDDAIVFAPMSCPSGDDMRFTTGEFGVLPSAAGQTIGVDVYDGTKLIATLNVPESALPKGAQAGDLLVFNYTIGLTEFSFNVLGFREYIIEVIDGM